MKFDEAIMADTNKHLPEDIRIFGFVLVTGSFNSKNDCNARTYQYTLRTELLRPSSNHPDFATRDKWTFGTEERARFEGMLKKFEGTRKYHNFTKGGTP